MLASSFRLILGLQVVLLVYDILTNALVDVFNPAYDIQLVLFILQDVALIFQLIVLLLEFFNTYASKAGFIKIMIFKYRSTLIITTLYFCVSIGLHAWTLSLNVGRDGQFVYAWGYGGYYALYVIQRMLSTIYYYYYRHTALSLGDPKYYFNSEWLRMHGLGKR